MKIVVNGGTGLIGSKTVARLRSAGHEVSRTRHRKAGFNSVTGEGVAETVKGAQVIVDLSNSPSWEDAAVLEFFQKSTGNLAAAAKANGVRHYIALSVVGTERLQASGYFVAKLAQERLIKSSGVPYTIVHSTQFFELLGFLVKALGDSADKVVVPAALIQPIASDDVADVMAEVATGCCPAMAQSKSPARSGSTSVTWLRSIWLRRTMPGLSKPQWMFPIPAPSSKRRRWFRTTIHASARLISTSGSRREPRPPEHPQEHRCSRTVLRSLRRLCPRQHLF